MDPRPGPKRERCVTASHARFDGGEGMRTAIKCPVDGYTRPGPARHGRGPSQRRLTPPVTFAVIYPIWGSILLAIRLANETLPLSSTAGTRFTVGGLMTHAFLRGRGMAYHGKHGPACGKLE